MQIDLVITELDVGGAESALTHLALGLRESGDDVRVFSIAPPPERRRLVDRLQSAGLEITFSGGARKWNLATVAPELRSWLRQRPGAICQSFLYHANVMTANLIGNRSRHFAGVRVADPRPMRTIVERLSLSRCRKIVCVSADVKSFLVERGFDAGRCVVIGNGVDVDRFASAAPAAWSSFGLPDDSVVTLFVGRLHAQKNLELLRANVDSIAPPGTNRRLVIVGDGPLRESLTAWAKSLGRNQVFVLPWQPDVAPLLAACGVLVLPSHFEGMPNVVMEAMAAGRPVVCSRVEGIMELLGDDHVQTFPPGDGAAMADRLAVILADPHHADQLGVANQAHVRNRFTIAAMVAEYRQLYAAV